MKPTVPITDPAFRYTPAALTDVRKLFARIRWERERAGIRETRTFVGTLEVARVDAVLPKLRVV